MKKKIQKAIACTIVAGGAVISGVFASDALAANTSDSSYSFTFSGNSVEYTPIRAKQNSTSAYMKLGYIADGDASYGAEVVDSNGKYFSKRFPLVYFADTPNGVYTGQYIKSYAYEDRGYGVNVKIKANGNRNTAIYNWKAGGVWSPDSI